MIYKKKFNQLSYDIKRRTVERFLLLIFLEILINNFLEKYKFPLSIIPLFWLIFTKKYFSFPAGLSLFALGFLCYFCFYNFSSFFLLLTAVAMFFAAHIADIDKLSAILAYIIQHCLFIFQDPNFNTSALIQSTIITFFLIIFCKIDITPSHSPRRKILSL
jgi:hypothetical protein